MSAAEGDTVQMRREVKSVKNKPEFSEHTKLFQNKEDKYSSIDDEICNIREPSICTNDNMECVSPNVMTEKQYTNSKIEKRLENDNVNNQPIHIAEKIIPYGGDNIATQRPEKDKYSSFEDFEDKVNVDAEDTWLQILGHEKLKKKVVKQGKGYFSRPVHGQVVTVRCLGKLADSTKVDQIEEFLFILGDGDVIQAFDLCVPLMELEETCFLETDNKYAYGLRGRSPDIPECAHITYEITLLNVEDAPNYAKLPIQEKIKYGVQKRERGNWWYSRNEYTFAVNSYNKALNILVEGEGTSEEVNQLNEERIKCYNNLGAAQLKIEAWDAAIKSCDAVLRLEVNNVKALFRKGKCLAGKGELERAIPVLRKALKIEPETKIIHNELARLVNKNKVQTQSAKEMYQRMMGTDTTKEKSDFSNNTSWSLYIGGAIAAACVSIGLVAYRYLHV